MTAPKRDPLLDKAARVAIHRYVMDNKADSVGEYGHVRGAM